MRTTQTLHRLAWTMAALASGLFVMSEVAGRGPSMGRAGGGGARPSGGGARPGGGGARPSGGLSGGGRPGAGFGVEAEGATVAAVDVPEDRWDVFIWTCHLDAARADRRRARARRGDGRIRPIFLLHDLQVKLLDVWWRREVASPRPATPPRRCWSSGCVRSSGTIRPIPDRSR